MLAESENISEVGTRAASPWDSLVSISTPGSPSPGELLTPSPPQSVSFPKLVPESDFGNIEYKLQLLSPSPSRFARLVTQLKWRLLEGNGQAVYELGVGDSGMLVGLTQSEMDKTLQTLEEMAGEIGASVIVVKEIPVPKGMIGIEDPGKGEGDHRRNPGSKRRMRQDAAHYAFLSAEELASTEDDTSGGFLSDYSLDPLDTDLSLFSMDPEPEYESERSDSSVSVARPSPSFSVDLQIASVYKPRPVRKRAVQVSLKGKNKKDKDKKSLLTGSSTTEFTSTATTAPQQQQTMTKQEAKSLHRRAARDRRREIKRQQQGQQNESVSPGDSTSAALIPQIEHLTVSTSADLPAVEDTDLTIATVNDRASEDTEKRLIVEAIVVRKMSLEESFLDFGGFALEV
ncbi:hypothetical protein DL96DRAFT_1729736 [Flagelloscypha sp. PMI_526]|nr:hypothetical protein DL96DRAFT_1729736 [Flagelloscypha sp. PMI_526]